MQAICAYFGAGNILAWDDVCHDIRMNSAIQVHLTKPHILERVTCIYSNIGYGYLDFYDFGECLRMYLIVFVVLDFSCEWQFCLLPVFPIVLLAQQHKSTGRSNPRPITFYLSS